MPKEKTTKNPTKKTQTTEKNGSQIILETLLQQGVIDVFGYPGGCVIPLFDEDFKLCPLKYQIGSLFF